MNALTVYNAHGQTLRARTKARNCCNRQTREVDQWLAGWAVTKNVAATARSANPTVCGSPLASPPLLINPSPSSSYHWYPGPPPSQISVVLHDECYLVHPHRLLMSTAVMDINSTPMPSPLTGGGGASTPGILVGATSQGLSSAAATGSSTGMASGAPASAGGATAGTAGGSAADAEAPLPAHLRSFEVFSRGLRVAPDVREGYNGGRNQQASTATSSSGSGAMPAQPPSPLTAALAEHLAAQTLLGLQLDTSSRTVASTQCPSDAAALSQGDLIAVALSKHRVDHGSSALSSLQALIVAVAGIVHARCFQPSTLEPAPARSLYLRQQLAPPVLQSVVSAGLVQPRQLWHGCSSLVRSVADLLHAATDAAAAAASGASHRHRKAGCKAGNKGASLASAVASSTTSAAGPLGTLPSTATLPTVLAPHSYRDPAASASAASTAGGSGALSMGRTGDGSMSRRRGGTADLHGASSSIVDLDDDDDNGADHGCGGSVSMASLSEVQMAAYRDREAAHHSHAGGDDDSDDGGDEEDEEGYDDGCGDDQASSSSAAASAAAIGYGKLPLPALRFVLEYSLRLLRWLALREYCSHLLYYRPWLAYSPGRHELACLPWGALPQPEHRPAVRPHHLAPQAAASAASSSSAAGSSASGVVAAAGSAPTGRTSSASAPSAAALTTAGTAPAVSAASASTAASATTTSSWWPTTLSMYSSFYGTAGSTAVGAGSAGAPSSAASGPPPSPSGSSTAALPSASMMLAFPALPTLTSLAGMQLLPTLPTMALPSLMTWTIDSAEAALSKQLAKLYEPMAGAAYAQALAAGLTGYPLVDAAVTAVEVTGHLPPCMLPLIAAVWCKHLGRPWHEAMRWLLLRSCDADVPLAVMRWQWSTGLGCGCDWCIPVDSPDVLSGFDLDLSPPLVPVSWPEAGGAGAGSSSSGAAYSCMHADAVFNGPADQHGPLAPGIVTKPSDLTVLLRLHPRMPPHPHSMAHPACVEFGSQPDPAGLFVRHWLCGAAASSSAAASPTGPARLSPSLPDAVILDPASSPPAVLQGAGQQLKPAGDLLRLLLACNSTSAASSSLSVSFVYPQPVTSLGRSRERALDCVVAVHKLALQQQRPSVLAMMNAAADAMSKMTMGITWTATPARDAVNSSGKGGSADIRRSNSNRRSIANSSSTRSASPAVLLDQRAAGFVSAQAGAGCSSAWGMVQSHPLLVEEDCALLHDRMGCRKEDGWSELLEDAPRKLKVYSQQKPEIAIRPHIANVSLQSYSEPEVYDAVRAMRKYASWDLTWAAGREICMVDPFNQLCYMVGDAPPAPYSYMITQRDFVILRHAIHSAASRAGTVMVRTGAHAAYPVGGPIPSQTPPGCVHVSTGTFNGSGSGYIRAEMVGVVGFATRRMDLSAGYRLATQCDGSVKACAIVPSLTPTATGGVQLYPSSQPHSPPAVPLPPAPGRTHLLMLAAGDPKGGIPGYLVNFVAKRTPRMWIDRLAQFCDKFREEAVAHVGTR